MEEKELIDTAWNLGYSTALEDVKIVLLNCKNPEYFDLIDLLIENINSLGKKE